MVDFIKASFINSGTCSGKCFSCSAPMDADEAMRLLMAAKKVDLAAKLGDRCLSRMIESSSECCYCPSCSAPINGCASQQFWECVCGTTFCFECRRSKEKHSRMSKCGRRFALFKSEQEKNDAAFVTWQQQEAKVRRERKKNKTKSVEI